MLRELVREILDICMEDLSANMDRETHTDYIMYRLNGGVEDEELWYRLECQ